MKRVPLPRLDLGDAELEAVARVIRSGTTRWTCGPGGLAVSEGLRDTTILLPLFHGMTEEEQQQVPAAVRDLGLVT